MKRLSDSISSDLLPLISEFKGKTFVIKYGGSIMNNIDAQNAFIEDVNLLKSYDINIVLVHGGGPEISRWLKKAGVESKFINGLRVTDTDTMEIVEMVLSGSVNKKLSANLSAQGINAIGMSGKDSNLIKARKKYLEENGEKIDIGFVGEVVEVNSNLLQTMLNNNLLPVVSPIGFDAEGNTYNINADYAASAIAASLKADKLIIMTDIAGVYKDINDPSSLLTSLDIEEIEEYIKCGIISGGMIPKLQCCVETVINGTKNVHLIDGRNLHSVIVDTFTNRGTKIIAKGGQN